MKEVQGEIIMFMPEKNSRVGIAALMFMDVREKPPENLEKKRERLRKPPFFYYSTLTYVVVGLLYRY